MFVVLKYQSYVCFKWPLRMYREYVILIYIGDAFILRDYC